MLKAASHTVLSCHSVNHEHTTNNTLHTTQYASPYTSPYVSHHTYCVDTPPHRCHPSIRVRVTPRPQHVHRYRCQSVWRTSGGRLEVVRSSASSTAAFDASPKAGMPNRLRSASAGRASPSSAAARVAQPASVILVRSRLSCLFELRQPSSRRRQRTCRRRRWRHEGGEALVAERVVREVESLQRGQPPQGRREAPPAPRRRWWPRSARGS